MYTLRALVLIISAIANVGFAKRTFKPYGLPEGSILYRDVLIVGGGSSGTHSAVRLHKLGKSVALVERKSTLGGHTNSFVDPISNISFDNGVKIFQNLSTTERYFADLGVSIDSVDSSFLFPKQDTADFITGAVFPTPPTNQTATAAAFKSYLAQLAKYPWLVDGLDVPSPVPDDLLLPFGDFIKKYHIEAIAFELYAFSQGLGDILTSPTLYILNNFGSRTVSSLFGRFFTTTSHRNQEIYEKATALLGPNALTNSEVISIHRNHKSPFQVQSLIQTPTGPKLIHAKNLLIAIPPKASNLPFLDLSPTEKSLLSNFKNTYYWNGIIRNTGTPQNTSYINASPKTNHGIPPLNKQTLLTLTATASPNLHEVFYSSPSPLPSTAVKSDILRTIKKIAKTNGLPVSVPEFVLFDNHTPYQLTVSTERIKDGFYGEMAGLQGKGNTWWTGAAWSVHDSSIIWDFTEKKVLPGLLA